MTEEKKGFKRTEVGLIPVDWKVKPFGDLTQPSKIKISASQISSKLPCIELEQIKKDVGQIEGYSNLKEQKSLKTRFSRGDVLFGKLRPYLRKYYFAEFEGACSTEIWVFDSTANFSNRFLFYLVQQDSFIEAANKSTGTHMPRADWNVIKENLIAVPPTLAEQQAIATALSDVDELIRSLDGLIQKKEAIKKGTMQQLLTGNKRLPGFNGEWEVKALGDVLVSSPDYGINAPAVDYNTNYPTYLRITDISEDGNFVQTGKKSVKAVNSGLYYLSEGEIVLARTGASTGKSYHYDPKDGELVFAGFLIRIKPDPSKAESKFLKYYLQTDQYWNWVEKNSMRSGQPGLNSVQYSSLKISFPNLEEQKAIAQILSDMDEELQALRHKREKMVRVKEGMMQELLTGRTRLVKKASTK